MVGGLFIYISKFNGTWRKSARWWLFSEDTRRRGIRTIRPVTYTRAHPARFQRTHRVFLQSFKAFTSRTRKKKRHLPSGLNIDVYFIKVLREVSFSRVCVCFGNDDPPKNVSLIRSMRKKTTNSTYSLGPIGDILRHTSCSSVSRTV